MEELIECACGCGKYITPLRHHRWIPARFILGHHTRGKARHVYTPTADEIPSGLCECGCGGRTTIAVRTVRSRRHFRGYPVPYIQTHRRPQLLGAESYKWKGGRFLHRGYVNVYAPQHHLADKNGYVLEHRLVMETVLGRELADGEVIHHINYVKDDNRPENLIVLTPSEHSILHGPLRIFGPEARARMAIAGRKGAEARWGKRTSG